ncbi:hypothetical protein P886_3426 [Alteromonadaceae bacterium 2753L.S.0a.02]|nr:hypothetical protein P886_3426 [Alteromonadaceae bacterium 2753L.S.0a.02]
MHNKANQQGPLHGRDLHSAGAFFWLFTTKITCSIAAPVCGVETVEKLNRVPLRKYFCTESAMGSLLYGRKWLVFT